MGDTVDMPLQEYQQIFASSYDAENLRAVRTMKGYYPKVISMFVLPRDGKIQQIPGNPQTYIPDEVFVSDSSTCSYPFLGADASSIPIEIGQRVGTTEMSLQTAREMDPRIADPAQEALRVTSEGLEKAILGGIEQQLAGGMLDPIVAAKIEIAYRLGPLGPLRRHLRQKSTRTCRSEPAASPTATATSRAARWRAPWSTASDDAGSHRPSRRSAATTPESPTGPGPDEPRAAGVQPRTKL